jgi:hypothetical protein
MANIADGFVAPEYQNFMYYSEKRNLTTVAYNISAKARVQVIHFLMACVHLDPDVPNPTHIDETLFTGGVGTQGRKFSCMGALDNDGRYWMENDFAFDSPAQTDRPLGGGFPLIYSISGNSFGDYQTPLLAFPYPIEGLVLPSGVHYALSGSAPTEDHLLAARLAHSILMDPVFFQMGNDIKALLDAIDGVYQSGAARGAMGRACRTLETEIEAYRARHPVVTHTP